MALLLRLNKAAPLTNEEIDGNLTYLDDRITTLEATKLSSADLLNHIKFIDGVNSGIDADKLDGMNTTDQAQVSTIVNRDSAGNFSANTIYANNFVGNASSANVALTLDGIVSIANGGTGASSLNPGFLSSDGSVVSSSSTISGEFITGNITGNASSVTGVVAIENGGTGATTATSARTALGLVVGQTVQAYSPILQMISGVNTQGLLMYGAGVVTSRTLTVGNGLAITNSNGVNGDPRIEITTVSVANGGTGANDAVSACLALGAARSDNALLTGVPSAPTAPNGTNTNQIATTAFVINNSVPTGTILTLATPAIPEGYLAANGALVLRSQYPSLFSAIGTLFGAGNGTTTFQLPNWATPTGFIAVIKT